MFNLSWIQTRRVEGGAGVGVYALLAVILIVYLLPVVAGFNAWGVGPTSRLQRFPHAFDTATGPLGAEPIREFIRNELSAGSFPWWQPNAFLGIPLVAQYEFQLLNPLEWLNWLGDSVWWSVVLCGYLFIGSLGVLAFCRQAGIERHSALLGSVAYAIAGFAPLFYTVPAFITAVPAIPWFFWGSASLLADTRRPYAFLASSTSAALVLLCGQPQIILCTLYFSAPFLATFLLRRSGPKGLLSPGMLLGLTSFLIALAIAAPQIASFADFVTSGHAFTTHDLKFGRSGWRATMPSLLNPVFPYSAGIHPYITWLASPEAYPVASEDFPVGFFASGAVLLFAGVGFCVLERRQPTLLALLISILFLSLTVLSQSRYSDYSIWPFSFVNVTRYSAPVIAFYGSALIAAGGASIEARLRGLILGARDAVAVAAIGITIWYCVKLRPGEIVSVPILINVLLLNIESILAAGLIVWVSTSHRFLDDKRMLAVTAIFISDAILQFRYGFPLYLEFLRLIPTAVAVAGALAYARFGKGLKVGAGLAAASVGTGWLLFAFTPQNPSELPRRLLARLDGQRVASSVPALIPNLNAPWNVAVVGSRNPVMPRAAQEYLNDQISPANIRDFQGFNEKPRNQVGSQYLWWPSYCELRSRLNLVGFEYLVGRAGFGALLPEPCRDGLSKVATDLDGYDLYRDNAALPRAYFSAACRPPKSENVVAEVLADVKAAGWRPIVENLPADAACATAKAGRVGLRITRPSSNEVEVEFGEDHDAGLVVLNDQFYARWLAAVDGRPADVLRTNGLVRGIVVGPDAHIIDFRYSPSRWPWLLSAAGLLGMVALFAILRLSVTSKCKPLRRARQ